jgi:hypothetical protein
MLTQDQAIELIKQERAYQDSTFDPTEKLPSGVTIAERDLELTSHLIMLKSYIDDAIDGWTWDYKRGTDEVNVLQQIAKIGAISVRALEKVGFSDKLLERGLRDKPSAQPTTRDLKGEKA